MTRHNVRKVLDRVLKWPPDRQEAAAEMLLAMEGEDGAVCCLTDEEWVAIEQGLREAEAAECACEADMEALFLCPGETTVHCRRPT